MRYAIILLAPLLALLAACDGAEEAPPTATPSPGASEPAPTPEATAPPSPTPTVAAESGGFDGFRAFATHINEAVQTGDASFFAASALPTTYTCMGGDADYFAPACQGQAAGATVQAFPLSSFPGEGSLITVAQYEGALQDWFDRAQPDLSDEYGVGRPALYALAYQPPSEFYEEAHVAIVTAIVAPTGVAVGERQIHLLHWQFLDGRWRLTADKEPRGGEALIADWLGGICGDCLYDRWERWEDTAP